MDLKFEVSGRINRPVEDVFEAVADPAKLSSYFTTGGAKDDSKRAQLLRGTSMTFPAPSRFM